MGVRKVIIIREWLPIAKEFVFTQTYYDGDVIVGRTTDREFNKPVPVCRLLAWLSNEPVMKGWENA